MSFEELEALLDRNSITREALDRLTYESLILSVFVELCNHLEESDNKAELRRKLVSGTRDGERYIYLNFIKKNLTIYLSEPELHYLTILLKAYLNKSDKRIRMEKSTCIALLRKQGSKCNYCKKSIKENQANVDHIVPFHYVGDELGEDNLQVLCESCNKSKSESVIFLFKIFIQKRTIVNIDP